MKRCARCREEKDEARFGIDKRRKDGLNIYCTNCNRAKGKESYRRLCARDVLRNRRRKLKRHYNLTPERHQAMYLAQNGCCALCKEPVEYNRIDADHSHATGEFRGLLCHRCNVLVGHVEKNETLMYDVFRWIGW